MFFGNSPIYEGSPKLRGQLGLLGARQLVAWGLPRSLIQRNTWGMFEPLLRKEFAQFDECVPSCPSFSEATLQNSHWPPSAPASPSPRSP